MSIIQQKSHLLTRIDETGAWSHSVSITWATFQLVKNNFFVASWAGIIKMYLVNISSSDFIFFTFIKWNKIRWSEMKLNNLELYESTNIQQDHLLMVRSLDNLAKHSSSSEDSEDSISSYKSFFPSGKSHPVIKFNVLGLFEQVFFSSSLVKKIPD